ncbi:hypothetical protein SCLCIDRAFT_536391 [Scleroderma citrinum Foug A]|uniref:Uncharacterized protein n=1 Tax=Scleroderma citrinum Foug A TaxID=1036808 RepID=A0A0C2ZUS9_9AGAM|nr:hypothetical protein SCLCIDRAFT_536391 [Scleroderma citrinum Foug A]
MFRTGSPHANCRRHGYIAVDLSITLQQSHAESARLSSTMIHQKKTTVRNRDLQCYWQNPSGVRCAAGTWKLRECQYDVMCSGKDVRRTISAARPATTMMYSKLYLMICKTSASTMYL